MNKQEFFSVCNSFSDEMSEVVHGVPAIISITSALTLVENIINEVTDKEEKKTIFTILNVSFDSLIFRMNREDREIDHAL